MCFEGLARLSRRVWRRFVRGSREISLAPSLHRASTDALIIIIIIIIIIKHTKIRCKGKNKEYRQGALVVDWTIYIPSPTEGLRAPGPTTGTPGYNHKKRRKKRKEKKMLQKIEG